MPDRKETIRAPLFSRLRRSGSHQLQDPRLADIGLRQSQLRGDFFVCLYRQWLFVQHDLQLQLVHLRQRQPERWSHVHVQLPGVQRIRIRRIALRIPVVAKRGRFGPCTTTFLWPLGAPVPGILVGINDSGPNYYTPYESMVFYNNTCYALNGGSYNIGLMWQSVGNGVSPAASVKHYNNIWVSGNPQYGTLIVNPVGGAVALSNFNCYEGGASSALGIGTGPAPSTTYSLSSWRSAMGQDANSISPSSGSGIFSSAGGAQNPGGYKLASGSVCAGAGRTGGTSSGTACDMGAWGYDPALGAAPYSDWGQSRRQHHDSRRAGCSGAEGQLTS